MILIHWSKILDKHDTTSGNYSQVRKGSAFDTKIVRVEIFGNRIIDRDEARELYKTVGIIAKGSESPGNGGCQPVAQFTKAAIEVATSEEGLRFSLADAVVVKSVTQKITG